MKKHAVLKRTRRGLRYVPISEQCLYCSPERVLEHVRAVEVAPGPSTSIATGQGRDPEVGDEE